MVTKLEGDTSEQRFEEVKKEIASFLKRIGFLEKNLDYLPLLDESYENLTTKSEGFPWHKGNTLLESLDIISSRFERKTVPQSPPAQPGDVRFTVLNVINPAPDYLVAAGRLVAGKLSPGDRLKTLPGTATFKIQELLYPPELHTGSKFPSSVVDAWNTSGAFLCLQLEGDAEALWPGQVLSGVGEGEGQLAQSFTARIFVMESELTVGSIFLLNVHGAHGMCKISKLINRMDRRTGRIVETDPSSLTSANFGEIECTLEEPIFLDSSNPVLRQIMLSTSNNFQDPKARVDIAALGFIKTVRHVA